jgi:hypothetical protein
LGGTSNHYKIIDFRGGKMKKPIYRKGLVFGMVVLIIGFVIAPGINASMIQENIDCFVIKKNKICSTNSCQSSSQTFDTDVISMINRVNNSLLFGYLEKIVSFGVRHTGSENCSRAGEYVHKEFQSLGLYSYIDKWNYPRYASQNVIGTYNGTDLTSDAVFVLTAHLDTIGDSVGANDDGSGVAALLTIAHIISKFTFNHTIKFVIVSGHEVGTYGSFDYAKKAYQRNENIIANLNVDMIANTSFGNIIGALTPVRSQWLYNFANDINQKYRKHIDIKLQLQANFPIDSQSFVDYGYDAISFVQLNALEYPVHTPLDTLDKVVYPYFENVTKLLLALTAELANRNIDVQVRIITPIEGNIYLFDRPLVELPGFNLFFTKVRAMTYLIGRSIVKINITTKEDIIQVSYSIDGQTNPFGLLYDPPYDWKLQKPFLNIFRLKGKHTVGVHVYTSTGKTAYDEMDFYALIPI